MNIKKLLSLGLVSLVTVGLLVGCSGGKTSETSGSGDTKKITVGATAAPHAEFLNEFAKAKLAEKGITLEVKEFTDYPTLNIALADKQLDANYFQHKPYLDNFNKENNTNLVSIGNIHAEPLAAYSKIIKSASEIKDGATIAIPNDNSNGARALKLLQKQGLIKLKSGNDDANLTEKDIAENPKNLKVKAVEAASLPRVLDEVDVAIINGNYALEAKLDTNSTLFAEEVADIEKHVNIVAAREDNKDDANLKELVNVLTSDDAKAWLKNKYGSAVLPANK